MLSTDEVTTPLQNETDVKDDGNEASLTAHFVVIFFGICALSLLTFMALDIKVKGTTNVTWPLFTILFTYVTGSYACKMEPQLTHVIKPVFGWFCAFAAFFAGLYSGLFNFHDLSSQYIIAGSVTFYIMSYEFAKAVHRFIEVLKEKKLNENSS